MRIIDALKRIIGEVYYGNKIIVRNVSIIYQGLLMDNYGACRSEK